MFHANNEDKNFAEIKKITQHANTGMHFYMQCRYPQTLRPTKITKKSILCYTLSKI